jgi:hypothetical protein
MVAVLVIAVAAAVVVGIKLYGKSKRSIEPDGYDKEKVPTTTR